MDKTAQKIVISFLKFLRGQLETANLNEDATESVEVAIQCLESAYDIEHVSPELTVAVPDLIELFCSSDIWFDPAEGFPMGDVPERNKAEAEKLKTEGNSNMKDDNFTEAIRKYTSAITMDPTNAVYFCNRAAAYSKLSNHELAIEDCKSAIKLDPTYSKAYGRLGIAFSSMNKHEEARASYLKALDLEPNNESYKNNLSLTNEQINHSGDHVETQGGLPGSSGSGSPPVDLSMLINNPGLMNMASQMLSNPNMQNIMTGILTLGQGDNNVEAFLQAGQQLAQQMQVSNPDFVESLRRQVTGVLDPANQPNPPSESDQNADDDSANN